MWDLLVGLSTWAEDNSGQIQIGIAFIAFILAYLGYRKALHQAKVGLVSINTAQIQLQHSLDQSNIASKNRFLDTKNEVLKIVCESIEGIDGAIIEIDSIRLHYIKSTRAAVESNKGFSTENFEKLNKAYEEMMEFRSTLQDKKQVNKTQFEEILNLNQDDAEKLELIRLTVLDKKSKLIEILGVVKYDQIKINHLLLICD